MEKQEITDNEAAASYGITTKHEKMPNGEVRFRLTTPKGNDYIRTVAGTTGAWQKAHSHQVLQETYIIESGWMALAESLPDGLKIAVYWPNQIVTTRHTVPHNVYLPAHAVIHTVKHGSSSPGDWKEEPQLTADTSRLSEQVILQNSSKRQVPVDARFASYVSLYNNLDSLLWRLPSILAAGTAVLIGFVASILSKGTLPSIPRIFVVGIFFFIGLLFLVSYYGMTRIRKHHTMAGEWLSRMEPDGYFHQRLLTVSRKWPPSATLIIRLTFVTLSTLFWILALLAVFRFQWIGSILRW